MRQSPVRLLNYIVKLATMTMTLDDHDLAPHPRVMPVMDRDVDPVILRSVSLSCSVCLYLPVGHSHLSRNAKQN